VPSRGSQPSRLLIVAADRSLIPEGFPLPHTTSAEVVDPWIVGAFGSSAPSDVENPWWVEMFPRGGSIDLQDAARQVHEAPVERAIGLRDTPPDLLSEPRFLIDVVGAALATSPVVIITLKEP
jgi:hypothetical protein